MIRWLLSAAAVGTLIGAALTFGPNGALGVAVCAAAVIVFFGVRAVRVDKRRARDYRERVWQRRDIEAAHLADLKPWPIGDDEVRR